MLHLTVILNFDLLTPSIHPCPKITNAKNLLNTYRVNNIRETHRLKDGHS